jgi:cyclopropane-fatty-acyl-phospholipid synthase
VRLALRLGLAWGRWQRSGLSAEERSAHKRALLRKFDTSPIAVHTSDANRQHYELPSAFFELVLGKRLKYSCCYWPDGVTSLDAAEKAMLELTCQRAQLEDGMDVLELGCGWGSLCLWIAARYPHTRVVAVSNSRTQKQYIDEQCQRAGLSNIETIHADVAELQLSRTFDRVVSVEMFEHMKNYRLLMARIADWLRPGGKLFVHIFSHRDYPYEFDASDANNWMARTFFAGGTMPSDDLLLYFQQDLHVSDHWVLDGTHYARTLRAWLDRLDAQKPRVREIMAATYGQDQAQKWLANWRLFFLACEAAWGSAGGREFVVSHYLFEKPQAPQSPAPA